MPYFVVLGAATLALPGNGDVDLGTHERHGRGDKADVGYALLHYHRCHVCMLGWVTGKLCNDGAQCNRPLSQRSGCFYDVTAAIRCSQSTCLRKSRCYWYPNPELDVRKQKQQCRRLSACKSVPRIWKEKEGQECLVRSMTTPGSGQHQGPVPEIALMATHLEGERIRWWHP